MAISILPVDKSINQYYIHRGILQNKKGNQRPSQRHKARPTGFKVPNANNKIAENSNFNFNDSISHIDIHQFIFNVQDLGRQPQA